MGHPHIVLELGHILFGGRLVVPVPIVRIFEALRMRRVVAEEIRVQVGLRLKKLACSSSTTGGGRGVGEHD